MHQNLRATIITRTTKTAIAVRTSFSGTSHLNVQDRSIELGILDGFNGFLRSSRVSEFHCGGSLSAFKLEVNNVE